MTYPFADPNGPRCQRLRELASRWIDAGQVQLRRVMVGLLTRGSAPQAATLLASDEPQAALHRHLADDATGGTDIETELSAAGLDRVHANNLLMQPLAPRSTPSTFYVNAAGQTDGKLGVPRPHEMAAIVGAAPAGFARWFEQRPDCDRCPPGAGLDRPRLARAALGRTLRGPPQRDDADPDPARSRRPRAGDPPGQPTGDRPGAAASGLPAGPHPPA